MTLGQRKAHKYIWSTLVVVMPLVIFFAIKDLNIFSLKNDSAVQLESSGDNLVKMSENELIKASLYEKDSARTIQIILKSPLKNPTSVVFTVNNNDKKGGIIGQLSTVGIYNFKIESFPIGIAIYDTLKETLITKLVF